MQARPELYGSMLSLDGRGCGDIAVANPPTLLRQDAGDRGWVVVETGVPGQLGRRLAREAESFGAEPRPARSYSPTAISITSARCRRCPDMGRADLGAPAGAALFIDGSVAYPPPDAKVGGIMPLFGPLSPTAPPCRRICTTASE